VVLAHHGVQASDNEEDEDVVMSKVREEGGLGFQYDVVAVLIPPHHPPPPELPQINDVVVAVLLHRPPLSSSFEVSIHGWATIAGRIAPWAASTSHSPPRWIPFTSATPDGDVNPILLPCPTVSAAIGGHPSLVT
jgi:hypothetical protein